MDPRLGAALCCPEVLSKHSLIISSLASLVGARESPGWLGGRVIRVTWPLACLALWELEVGWHLWAWRREGQPGKPGARRPLGLVS